jgi:hypothetical protein
LFGWCLFQAGELPVHANANRLWLDQNQRALKRLLNLRGPVRDQVQAPSRGGKLWGLTGMKSVRPDNSDPIPMRTPPHNMGTIMIRFVGLLLAAVVAMALIWSR